ncbi:MAG TPA: FkbM family methyltransferase [Verrucomicrobiae bacterium]|nr:FkbM family methyltransferase [Verrucomicrobiae bacterium]
MTSPDIVHGLCAAGFQPRHIVEVGVYEAGVAQSKRFIEAGARVELIEPQAAAVESLRATYGDRSNVVIHAVAIADKPGSVLLVSRGASSHTVTASEAPAGAAGAGDAAGSETVPAVTFDSIDDGTIDLLFCDIEGAEWQVISRLKSLPDVIVVETHGHRYINPRIRQIVGWMIRGGYRLVGHDAADTVWSRLGRDRAKAANRTWPLPRWIGCLLRIHARRLLHGLREGPRSPHGGGK